LRFSDVQDGIIMIDKNTCVWNRLTWMTCLRICETAQDNAPQHLNKFSPFRIFSKHVTRDGQAPSSDELF
jgi:hypothetical protein